MVAITLIIYTVALLAATATAAAIAIPPFPLASSTQLTEDTTRTPLNTTFVTSTTAAVAPAELASGVTHGSISERQLVPSTNSLGVPDCILPEDPRCFCCQPRFPSIPLLCRPNVCCPCAQWKCGSLGQLCAGNED